MGDVETVHLSDMGLKDLGWHNDDRRKPEIDTALARCRAWGHRALDIGVGAPYQGGEHIVSCERCGFVYRYDSSD